MRLKFNKFTNQGNKSYGILFAENAVIVEEESILFDTIWALRIDIGYTSYWFFVQ